MRHRVHLAVRVDPAAFRARNFSEVQHPEASMFRALAVLILSAAPALAFERVTDRSAFVGLVEGRTLTSLGVSLRVLADGKIAGRAFGSDVTGTWDWRDGLFCRAMAAGSRSFPLNCQVVELDGTTLRFIADEGQGDRADLRIR